MYSSLNASYGPPDPDELQVRQDHAGRSQCQPRSELSAGSRPREPGDDLGRRGISQGNLQAGCRRRPILWRGPICRSPEALHPGVARRLHRRGNDRPRSRPAASGYGGTSPAAAGSFSQNSYAAYLDIETDLTKALSVGAAGRYEHYNTFGGAWVGKFNAIYKIVDAFSIRGTIGSGFHAPSPGQSHDSILTTSFKQRPTRVQTGTYPVDTPISRYYGAVPLSRRNRPITAWAYPQAGARG
ncbi:MAG: TonB-dependent receptor [Sphingomonas sp.]